MNFSLTQAEIDLLSKKDICFDTNRDYTENEALDFLDEIRDMEVMYAQDTQAEGILLYQQFAALGDTIFSQIP